MENNTSFDYQILREYAVGKYNEALISGNSITTDYDRIFMECCIDAGMQLDEAVDAALQKIRLYMSDEAKLAKQLGKQTHKAIKKGDYKEALKLAKRRLDHLENLEKRANEIDDDEIYMLQLESIVKAFAVTAIVSMILVALADGLVPGSGPIVDAIKTAANKVKFKKFSDNLGGDFMSMIQSIVTPILTIAGISKVTGNIVSSLKRKKWEKDNKGDINREVNEGRPDIDRMSMSRTEAKHKFRKLIDIQKMEIKSLEATMKYEDQQAMAEAVAEELFTAKLSGLNETVEIINEAKLNAEARKELPDSVFGLPDIRKFPLNDDNHIKAAIKMFAKCPNDRKAELAKNIYNANPTLVKSMELDPESEFAKYLSMDK